MEKQYFWFWSYRKQIENAINKNTKKQNIKNRIDDEQMHRSEVNGLTVWTCDLEKFAPWVLKKSAWTNITLYNKMPFVSPTLTYHHQNACTFLSFWNHSTRFIIFKAHCISYNFDCLDSLILIDWKMRSSNPSNPGLNPLKPFHLKYWKNLIFYFLSHFFPIQE